MRARLRCLGHSAAVAAALICSEWWLFAGLALFWMYVRSVGVNQEGVLESTEHGLAWLWLGIVIMVLFPTFPGWHIGVGMVGWGWFCMGREPLWHT